MILFTFLVVLYPTYACQPCQKSLSLEETINESDYIIIGQKIKEAPLEGYDIGPEWTEIKVLQVLKGVIKDSSIKTRSWYGMCNYGIILDDNTHLIFLEYGYDSELEENIFHAVGCATKTIYVNDNFVTVEGDELTINEFSEKFNLPEPIRISNNNMGGITYKEDCLIGAGNFVESFLCNFTWRQSQYIKTGFIVVLIMVLIAITYWIFKKIKKD